MEIRIVKSSQVWDACKIHGLAEKLRQLRLRRLRCIESLERLVADTVTVNEKLHKLKAETDWACAEQRKGR